MDTSGNGRLSRAEVIKAARTDPKVRKLLDLPEIIRQEDGSRDRFEQVFQAMDGDDSEEVDHAEFAQFVAQLQRASGGGGGGGRSTRRMCTHVRISPIPPGDVPANPSVRSADAQLRIRVTSDSTGRRVLSLPAFTATGGFHRKATVSGAQYDSVHDAVADNDDDALYESVAVPLMEAVEAGEHACMLTYGQTGTGKTHNVWRAILPRVGRRMFASGAAVRVAVLQIYNEATEDLLATPGSVTRVSYASGELETSRASSGSTVQLSSASEGIIPLGLRWRRCTSLAQLRQELATAAARRQRGQTKMNLVSSRAHAVVFLQPEAAQQGEALPGGGLAVVDLAGSERLKKSLSVGRAKHEAIAINTSLHALSQVIGALATRARHVPVRASKLTMTLEPFLRRGARIALLVCVSPSPHHLAESAASLEFAQRAMQVQLPKYLPPPPPPPPPTPDKHAPPTVTVHALPKQVHVAARATSDASTSTTVPVSAATSPSPPDAGPSTPRRATASASAPSSPALRPAALSPTDRLSLPPWTPLRGGGGAEGEGEGEGAACFSATSRLVASPEHLAIVQLRAVVEQQSAMMRQMMAQQAALLHAVSPHVSLVASANASAAASPLPAAAVPGAPSTTSARREVFPQLRLPAHAAAADPTPAAAPTPTAAAPAAAPSAAGAVGDFVGGAWNRLLAAAAAASPPQPSPSLPAATTTAAPADATTEAVEAAEETGRHAGYETGACTSACSSSSSPRGDGTTASPRDAASRPRTPELCATQGAAQGAAAPRAAPPVAVAAATTNPPVAVAVGTVAPPTPATAEYERPWLGRALVVLVMLLAALLSGGGSSADAVELHDVSAAARGGCSRPATFALEALDVGVGSRRPRSVGVAGSWDGFSRTLPLRRERDGRFAASVRLPCGVVTYQYNVDGIWVHNPRFASQIGAQPPGLRRAAANALRALSLPARRLGRLLRIGAPPTASPTEQRLELYNLLEVARPPHRRVWWPLF